MDPNLTQFSEYIVPLVIAKQNEEGKITLERFAGCSYFNNSLGMIATCSHIVEGVGKEELLVAQNFNTKKFHKVTDIWSHPTIDFAVGNTGMTPSKFIPPYEGDVLPGLDVLAFGYSALGKFGNNLKITSRMLKGYISRVSENNDGLKTKEIMEVSFPSISGFSGTPVWVWGTRSFAGLLFSNLESSIEVYAFEENSSSDITIREKIFRVIPGFDSRRVNFLKKVQLA